MTEPRQEGRERRIAAALGLPWTWRVRERQGRLFAFGPALGCGHRSISAAIKDGDVLVAVARLATAVAQHKGGV